MGGREPGTANGRRRPDPGWIRRARHLIGSAAAASAVACGGGEGRDAPPHAEVHPGVSRPAPGSPAGVRRIATARPAWRGEARLELHREIPGAADLGAGARSSAPLELTRVRDVTATEDGTVLVLDGADARISVLDGSGRLERTLGRRGDGPGELRSPDRVEPGRDGGIAVLERRPPAIQFWNGDGAFERRQELVTGGDLAPARDTRPIAVEVADWGPVLPEGRSVRLVRLDPADPSTSRSRVYVADSTGRIGTPVTAWRTAGTRSRLPEVFGARRSWTGARAADGSGRIVVARGDRYELRAYDTSGRLRTLIRRDVEPEAVTAALRDRAVQRFAEEAARAGAPPSLTRKLREDVPVADALPVIGDLWYSRPDRRVWVGIPGPGGGSESLVVVRAYDVYAPGGSYLGRVPAPSDFRLRRVRGDLLYGSWRDSLDVPGIRVYRLVEPEGGARTP